jgi:hypothetical protein
MGNNTSSYTPCILYGVMEKSDNKVLSENFLKTHSLQRFASHICNTNGYGYVYGVLIELSDINKEDFEGKQTVINFVKYMEDTYDIIYENADFYMCIQGDYIINNNLYSFDHDIDINRYYTISSDTSSDDNISNGSCSSISSSGSNSESEPEPEDKQQELKSINDIEDIMNRITLDSYSFW